MSICPDSECVQSFFLPSGSALQETKCTADRGKIEIYMYGRFSHLFVYARRQCKHLNRNWLAPALNLILCLAQLTGVQRVCQNGDETTSPDKLVAGSGTNMEAIALACCSKCHSRSFSARIASLRCCQTLACSSSDVIVSLVW